MDKTKEEISLENEDIIEVVPLGKKPKIRLDYLDIAKALTIYIVVIGHVPDSFDAPFYRMVMYTFNMPLFFIVSGAVTKRHSHFEKYNLKNFLEFVKKNFLALVVPYLIWSLIYMQFDIKKIPFILYGTRWSLNEAASNTVFWFLPCLFSSRIIVELLLWLSTKFKIHRRAFASIAAIILFVLGFVLPVPEMQLPFGLSQAPIASGFILLGYALKGVMDEFHKKGILLHVIVLTMSTILFYIGVFVIEGQELVSMFVCTYGNPIRFFVNATTGCVMTMSLSSLIAKIPEKALGEKVRSFLLWLGRSTMGIYLVHVPVTRNLIGPFMEETFGIMRMNFMGGFISGTISLAISCVLMAIIERYIPQLFGKKLGKAYM